MFRDERIRFLDNHQPPRCEKGERSDLVQNARQGLPPGNRLIAASLASAGNATLTTQRIDSLIK